MFLSMTGYGDARLERAGLSCSVEIRSVNNRYLKVLIRTPERFAGLEPDIERVIREGVQRGTVNASVRIAGDSVAPAGRLNRRALEDYIADLQSSGLYDRSLLGSLLGLPGVVEVVDNAIDLESVAPLVRQTLAAALEKLQRMRAEEGAAMQRELLEGCGFMTALVDAIADRAPEVVQSFRNRLHERVQALLNQLGVAVAEAELVREVSIFAERSDIGEELLRLRSHLAQLREALDSAGGGRKLDFLVQEMNREANTIGAKANDAAIAHLVVDLKGRIDRAREIVQNVE